ncbi:MAG: hypothetical protein PHE58_06565 [Candidatus Omnitrophica bacterium]|nr:hypothetical protein [Candidatus Omnitrophota bacterium]
MKKVYNIGDDIFLVVAFACFFIGGISKLLGISTIAWGITSHNLISLSVVCLFFSIALSLYDLANENKKI